MPLDEFGMDRDIPIAFLNNRAAWDHYCEHAEKITTEAVDHFLATNTFDHQTTAEGIYPTMKLCTDAIWSRQYDIADHLLVNFPYDTANALMCTTVVRSTCASKSHLPHWRESVNRVRAIFDQRGLDSARLLRGLLDD